MSLTIAIFGNTNNGPLLLAQGLKELGHEVRLILNRKEMLHRPESRYPDWSNAYPHWIFDCCNITDEDIAYQTPAIDQLLPLLIDGVDLAILNDTGPALAGFLKAPHVAFLTGSDLAYWADFGMLQIRSAQWDPDFKESAPGRRYLMKFTDFVARQRDGILGAKLVCYPRRGLIPSGDALLDQIGVQDKKRFMLYVSNLIDLKAKKPAKNSRLTILNGCRVIFRPDLHPELSTIDFKNTDVLLAGFAQYINAGGQAELRMVKKGQDVDAALKLVKQLGIQNQVTWLNEMTLASFYEEMVAADLICDQLGASFPGGVALDAYALGRPVLANFRNDILSQRFPEPLPGFNASTPAEIADHLHSLESDHKLRIKMGQKSRAYAESYLAPARMAQELIGKIYPQS